MKGHRPRGVAARGFPCEDRTHPEDRPPACQSPGGGEQEVSRDSTDGGWFPHYLLNPVCRRKIKMNGHAQARKMIPIRSVKNLETTVLPIFDLFRWNTIKIKTSSPSPPAFFVYSPNLNLKENEVVEFHCLGCGGPFTYSPIFRIHLFHSDKHTFTLEGRWSSE